MHLKCIEVQEWKREREKRERERRKERKRERERKKERNYPIREHLRMNSIDDNSAHVGVAEGGS